MSTIVKLKAIPILEWEKAMKRLKDCGNKKCIFYVFVLFRDAFEE